MTKTDLEEEVEEVTATIPQFEVLAMCHYVPDLHDCDSLEECESLMVSMIEWNTAAPVCTLVDGEPSHELDDNWKLKPISSEMAGEALVLLARIKQ